ncbi:MAG: hypothetical protein JWN04_6914 [Myxococcaceae bacterium]|nr:hypothetical protein [Myxococcaceae bacterium]
MHVPVCRPLFAPENPDYVLGHEAQRVQRAGLLDREDLVAGEARRIIAHVIERGIGERPSELKRVRACAGIEEQRHGRVIAAEVVRLMDRLHGEDRRFRNDARDVFAKARAVVGLERGQDLHLLLAPEAGVQHLADQHVDGLVRPPVERVGFDDLHVAGAVVVRQASCDRGRAGEALDAHDRACMLRGKEAQHARSAA